MGMESHTEGQIDWSKKGESSEGMEPLNKGHLTINFCSRVVA